MDALDRIALDRVGVLACGSSPVDPARTAHLLAELAHLGTRVVNPEALTGALTAEPRALLSHLSSRRGERGTFAPLFQGFPDRLPAADDARLRFLLSAVRLVASGWDGGEVSDDQLRHARDFSDVGWWPASSVPQSLTETLLARAAQEILPGDTRTEWADVRLVSLAERDELLRGFMVSALTAASSLREDVTADLRILVEHFGLAAVDLSAVRFRETRTLLLELLWRADPRSIAALQPTPDDLLRLLAVLTASDVSLMTPIRFPRLSRRERRAVVSALEASPRLPDVFRRRGLWLALDRGLHLGELRAPRTQEVFARLRASRHDATSTLSRLEALLLTDRAAAYGLLAEEAPGLLARSLRRLAALADGEHERAALLAALAAAGAEIPLRLLLAARVQIADNGATYPRAAFLKNGQPLVIDRAPGHLALPPSWQQELCTALSAQVTTRLAALPSWAGAQIHLDPALDGVLVPEALRATSPGLVQVERGSRLPLGDAPVVRLFVHWREGADQHGADLDLSCMALDADLQLVEFVSWTNLANGAMVHSGDLTSAPHGAQEFIDVDLAQAAAHGRARGWRYLVPAIFRYAGPTFTALEEAHAGWMLREECSADRRSFDPKTVANAFALTGAQRTAVPFLLDLERSEVCYVDVYTGGAPHASVERDSASIGQLARAVLERRSLRLSISELVAEHVRARGGELVDDVASATVTFGLTDAASFNVLRPERLLAELL